MPLEFHAEVLSASSPYQAEHRRLAAAVVAAIIAILLLLQLALGSWRLAALALLVTPVAVSGALLATPFVGGIRSLPSMLGLLAVLGLAIRANVLLIRGYQDAAERDRTLTAAGVLVITREQLTAVVLPALLTAAAMLPLAFGGVHAGTELLQPMAVVFLAGLVTSTLFSLFLLPALCLRFGGRRTTAEPAEPTTAVPADVAQPADAEQPVKVSSPVPAGVAPIVASAPTTQAG
jgi:Cu/Ag efflux pump CusA